MLINTILAFIINTDKLKTQKEYNNEVFSLETVLEKKPQIDIIKTIVTLVVITIFVCMCSFIVNDSYALLCLTLMKATESLEKKLNNEKYILHASLSVFFFCFWILCLFFYM